MSSPTRNIYLTPAHRFSLVPSVYSLSQPHQVTASHRSLGDNQQSTGGRSERTQDQANMTACNPISYICTRGAPGAYAPGLRYAPCMHLIISQPPPSFLCCPRPPSRHPSSITSVYFVPARHLLPPIIIIIIINANLLPKI